MVARGFMIAAVAIAACACASTAPRERASLQSAMYMVGDNTPLLRASAGSAAVGTEGQFPVIKQLYWFFAGR